MAYRIMGVRGLGAAVPSFNYDTYLGVQQALNYLGVTDDAGSRLAEDGTMGSRTRQALVTFQKMYMITADGSYGPESKATLQKAVAEKANPLPTPPDVKPPLPDVKPPSPDVKPSTCPSGQVLDSSGKCVAGPVKPAVPAQSSNTMLYLAGGAVLLGAVGYFMFVKK